MPDPPSGSLRRVVTAFFFLPCRVCQILCADKTILICSQGYPPAGFQNLHFINTDHWTPPPLTCLVYLELWLEFSPKGDGKPSAPFRRRRIRINVSESNNLSLPNIEFHHSPPLYHRSTKRENGLYFHSLTQPLPLLPIIKLEAYSRLYT